MGNTDKIISDFFNSRYEYLIKCANNILKLIKKQELTQELVSDCYLYIIENIDKLEEKIIQGKIEQMCVRWMTMQVKWRNTQFKKNWVYNDEHKTYLDDKLHHNNDATLLDAIMIEEDDEETILQKEMEYQNKINHIETMVQQLPIDKKLLYDIIYVQGHNTSGKLSKFIGLSRTPSYRLMKELKELLRDSYKQ